MGSGIGWSEVLVILLVALIVLGPKKLPDVAKSLGKSIRELRNAFNGLEHELRDDGDRKEPAARKSITVPEATAPVTPEKAAATEKTEDNPEKDA